MASSSIDCKIEEQPARKRRRLNESERDDLDYSETYAVTMEADYLHPMYRKTHFSDSPCYELRMSTARFLSFPLAVFIHDDEEESNYEIAKRIVNFYDHRDEGFYAAVVGDESIECATTSEEGKCRYVERCRGKYIKLYKQARSSYLRTAPRVSTVKSMVKGLIADIENCSALKRTMNEIFGGKWSVVKGSGTPYCHYDIYSITVSVNEERWKLWRHPE